MGPLFTCQWHCGVQRSRVFFFFFFLRSRVLTEPRRDCRSPSLIPTLGENWRPSSFGGKSGVMFFDQAKFKMSVRQLSRQLDT